MATTVPINLPARELTTHEIFQKTLDKTTHWLKDIKDECGLSDLHQAYALLRAVLFTLRDRTPMPDTVHFAAQLPMLIRGFYYESWVPIDTPDKGIKTESDFYNTVKYHIGTRPGLLGDNVERYTWGVLKVINKHVPQPEMSKIENVMPHNLKKLFSPSQTPSTTPTTTFTSV